MANLTFWPLLPIALLKFSSVKITSNFFESTSTFTLCTSAGDNAFETTIAGSSDQLTISIFSPCNSLTTAWTLYTLMPTDAPTWSKDVSIALTQIFALLPGSLADDLISISPS